jgi:outer membrane autotransporter protein
MTGAISGTFLTFLTLTEDSTLNITGTNISSGSSMELKGISINGDSNAYSIDVINDGTLTVTNSKDFALGMYIWAVKGGSSITNNGTINVESGGMTKGVYTLLKTGSTFSNTGTIIVNGNNYDNGGMPIDGLSRAIELNAVDQDETASNSGTITAKTNGEFHGYGYALHSSGVYGHALNFTNSGTMNGNILLGKGTFTNSGTLSLPHNATNAQIENFVNEANGVLEIGLKTNGTTTTHSKLSTTDATFDDGSTIKVNVLSSSSNVSLLAGEIFEDVVSASNALTINGTLNIDDNSALLNFEYMEDGETIDLKAVQGQSVGSTITGNNRNAQAAAGTLQSIVDNSGNYSQMNGVITALNGLATNAEVEKAVDSTTPQTTTASFTAATQISNNVSNIITQRQNVNLNSSGLNSGDELLSQKNIWVKPYGSFGQQDDKDGLNGFDIKTYGIGVGADAEYSANQKVGVGLFYTNADVDVNNVSQSSDMDVYSLIVYGNVPVIDDTTNFLYQAGYSWQKTNTSRKITFMNTTAKADYTSKIASLDLKLIKDYKLNQDLLLQPFVATTYRHFETPNYSETGAGALNLNVNEFSSSEFIVALGSLVHYKLNEDSRVTSSLQVGYDLKDDNNVVNSSYQGASGLSYNTEGIDNGRVSYDLGFGYENDLNDLSNVSVNYNLQGEGSDYLNHVVSVKYTYNF